MPFDPGLVARVADALEQIGERGIRQKGIFGGRGFMIGKHAFVIVWHEGVLVKLTPDAYPAALEQQGVIPFAPGGDRPMGTWVVVNADVVADDPELIEWVRRGLTAVRT